MNLKIKRKGIYRNYFKRLFDILVSLVSIVVLSPVILISAIMIRFKLGSPVIFAVKRPGYNEEIFTIYKFRSMSNERDEHGELLPDAVRLTKFGRFLRASSLDELPELYNILTGKMSLVGPRPLAFDYLPHYKELERLRHSVRPGLTGLAQINGRNFLSWEERFAYDVYYAENISFILDMKIIFKTFFKVAKSSDMGVRGVDYKDNSLDIVRSQEKHHSTKE